MSALERDRPLTTAAMCVNNIDQYKEYIKRLKNMRKSILIEYEERQLKEDQL
jgi:hypothetical protein